MKQSAALIFILLILQLAGCATTPEFDQKQTYLKLTPTQVSASAQPMTAKKVIWSGMILHTTNLQNATRLEVLAYPFSSGYRPQTKAEPVGRFILTQDGYLEKAEYAEGRYISVQGTITGTMNSKVGDTNYVYPLLKADKIFLWPKDFENQEPTFHFGFGISISR